MAEKDQGEKDQIDRDEDIDKLRGVVEDVAGAAGTGAASVKDDA
jgi:hypothetical protein